MKTIGKGQKKVKFMSLAAFQDAGYLQEVNRQLLHRLGLALAVKADTETGETVGFAVVRLDDDEEGYVFDSLDPVKADRIQQELLRRDPIREKALGWVVQPVVLLAGREAEDEGDVDRPAVFAGDVLRYTDEEGEVRTLIARSFKDYVIECDCEGWDGRYLVDREEYLNSPDMWENLSAKEGENGHHNG